jgi:predicted metal-dependent hydrolase
MPQKKVELPGVGELILAKRRGAKNVRLSVTATGQIRVSLPAWAPYAAGISFAKNRLEWIQKHLEEHQVGLFFDGMKVGKAHRLAFVPIPEMIIQTRLTKTEVIIKSNWPITDERVQRKIKTTSEKALKTESQTLLPMRLIELAAQHGFTYKEVKIKKLTGRWGSCSSDKTITLSYYLIQLPWYLIDYVLLHELIHTKHMNHSQKFWSDFESIQPNIKSLRREIKAHKPTLQPS